MNKPKIIPAILAADKIEFQLRLEKLVGLVNQIQIDFTDNTLTAGKTVPLKVAIQLAEGFTVDLHLMVDDPFQYSDHFREITGTIIWHLEAPIDHLALIKKIKKTGRAVGLAINPPTPARNLESYLKLCDEILIMTVVPGQSGQPIIRQVLPKITQLKTLNPKLIIGVDGGINPDNISEVAAFKPDKINVGSGLFRGNSVEKNLHKMQVAIG